VRVGLFSVPAPGAVASFVPAGTIPRRPALAPERRPECAHSSRRCPAIAHAYTIVTDSGISDPTMAIMDDAATVTLVGPSVILQDERPCTGTAAGIGQALTITGQGRLHVAEGLDVIAYKVPGMKCNIVSLVQILDQDPAYSTATAGAAAGHHSYTQRALLLCLPSPGRPANRDKLLRTPSLSHEGRADRSTHKQPASKA
jgi:hypothetical protein